MLRVALALAACGLSGELATVLERVVQAESGGVPHALAVHGDLALVHPPRDRGEAVAMASWLRDRGYGFDAGLAQVSSANFERLGLTVETAFEPCPNLRAAARVLGECRARAQRLLGTPALAAILSCYNTGHLTRGERSGYVALVLGARAAGQPDRKGVQAGPPETPARASGGHLAARAPDVFEGQAGR